MPHLLSQSLANFLGNNKYTFDGKAIGTDAKKFFKDYELKMAKVRDVSEMATTK